jgi:hypothetical protein
MTTGKLWFESWTPEKVAFAKATFFSGRKKVAFTKATFLTQTKSGLCKGHFFSKD